MANDGVEIVDMNVHGDLVGELHVRELDCWFGPASCLSDRSFRVPFAMIRGEFLALKDDGLPGTALAIDEAGVVYGSEVWVPADGEMVAQPLEEWLPSHDGIPSGHAIGVSSDGQVLFGKSVMVPHDGL